MLLMLVLVFVKVLLVQMVHAHAVLSCIGLLVGERGSRCMLRFVEKLGHAGVIERSGSDEISA
jgi:hypothetical protein